MDARERARKAASAKKNTTTASNTATNKNNIGDVKILDLSGMSTNFIANDKPQASISNNVSLDANGKVSVNLPNLPVVDTNAIGGLLKTTQVKQIEDVRQPGFSTDELVDERTYEKAKIDYQSAIRYQELLQWANKYHGSQYQTLASQAKAYQQGLLAATEIERVYQQFLELAKQQSITIQKGSEYIAQAHKTATVQASLPYSVAENEAKLEKTRLKALRAFEETKLENDNFKAWLQDVKGEKSQSK